MNKLTKKSRTAVTVTTASIESLPIRDRQALSKQEAKLLITKLHQLNDGSIENAKILRAIIERVPKSSQSYNAGANYAE